MPIEANPPPMVAYFPRQQPEKVLSLNEQENEEQHKKGPSERVRGPRVEIQSKRQGVIAAVREHRSRGQSEFGEVGSDQDRSTVLVETKGGHKEIGTVDGADSVRGYVDELTNRHELVLSKLGIEQSAIVETMIQRMDSGLTVDEVQNQARLGIEEQLPKLEVLANDLRHEMSDQELQELFQLNPEVLRRAGLTELADVAKHKDRLVGEASGVIEDIIGTGGDLSKVDQIVEAATGKKNEANARNIIALAEVGLIAAAVATKDKKLRSALLVSAIALTLTGCGNVVDPTAAVENTPAVTAPSVETATPEITPTVVVEPTLRPTPTVAGVEYSPMAVNPPVMNLAELPMGQVMDGVRDDSAAAAVYALVRTENGPQNYQNNEDFVEKMNQYLAGNPEVNLVQVKGEGVVYSMLVNNKGQIYLVFNSQNGALVSADPGYWSKDGHGEWIEAANPGDKESVSLVPGEDGHAYMVKLDADGKVIAYLNTHGATRDNIDQQWINVVDGMPEKVWDGRKWVEAERKPEFVVNFNTLTPESIDDVAGVVRRDKLQGDLAILHQEIFEALEAEGVTIDHLPYIQINDIKSNATPGRKFFPSEYGGMIQIFNFNELSQVRAVLTGLNEGEGYVLTVPVDSGDGSGEILLADFVIDFRLLRELDAKRATAGSEYELINEEFIKDELIPKLQVNFQPIFYGPFGELRDEYLQYAGMLVEANSNNDREELNDQIKEGKVFLVVKCNMAAY